MSNPKISVIVAVYNAEKTLDRLAQSLVSQTLTDFEVLLIDDGSSDSSGSICDKYAQQDQRFKVFHKANEGIGSTRQFGIDRASGEYTIHADSDDWVEPDYLEKLYDKAVETGADMVVCDYVEETHKSTRYCKQEIIIDDGKSLLHAFFKLHGGSWNKLIKRSAYQNAGIMYMDGLEYGEDKLFNLQLVIAGIAVSYLPAALYHYDVSANLKSAARDISMKQILNREKYIEELRKLLPDNDFETPIDSRNLEIVYMAIMSKSFVKSRFKEKYSFLSRVRWKDYENMSFPLKLIIWTSLNCSFELAVFLSGIKRFIRCLKQ